jgi:hypothetical protein
VSLQQSAQLERSKVDVPDTIVDLLQVEIVAGTGDADIDPAALPADTAVGG